MVLKQIALYGTQFTGAFALGFANSYGQEKNVPLELGMVALPITSGLVSAVCGPSKKEPVRCDNALSGLVMVMSAGSDLLESAAHGFVGTVGTTVSEGLGYLAGYVVAKY